MNLPRKTDRIYGLCVSRIRDHARRHPTFNPRNINLCSSDVRRPYHLVYAICYYLHRRGELRLVRRGKPGCKGQPPVFALRPTRLLQPQKIS